MLSSWNNLFHDLNIESTINQLDKNKLCPEIHNILRCFTYFDVLETRVVICGQDPYHTEGVATGLAFDVSNKRYIQPSLRNIFKEIERTYPDAHCDIEAWCMQGVLMFNRSLTVEKNKPNSHSKYWKNITNEMIRRLSKISKENDNKIVFMLWGNNAQELENYIGTDYHIILKHTHPSPLSRKPFVGNNHFKLCNEYLKNNEISW